MRRFLIKLVLFIGVVTLPYFWFQYQVMLETDPFYWKATHRANHLVLGGSRALKGIYPSILKEELQLKGEMLNFAFTGVLSPYGEKYVEAIKRKLNSGATSSVFILSVCPGNVMDFSEAVENREKAFRFYKMWSINSHPNIEYVLRHPRKGRSLLLELIEPKKEIRLADQRTYQDGSQGTYLPVDYQAKEREKVIRFALKKSAEREVYLQELIAYLAERGSVVLVRVPVSDKTLDEENIIYSDFDTNMASYSRPYNNVWYLNYTIEGANLPYRYSDGNHHLEGHSAEAFTKVLGQNVRQLLAQ